MDFDFAKTLLDPFVLAYLVIVIGAQLYLAGRTRAQQQKVAEKRRQQGLPPDFIIDTAQRLSTARQAALRESLLLLGTIFLTPFVLVLIGRIAGLDGDSETGLAVVFLALVLWLLLNGTDVAKAFLGGLAFRTLTAFKSPIQVGDRVTLKGHGGKVTEIGTFFVTLETPNDDLINIPTRDLWSEVLVSANAGARSSLVVMDFYLAPFVSQDKRQSAEDAIWDAVQASPYFEAAQPMQIFINQEPQAIHLTAKAYVASTYNEPLFISDVTRAFLEFTDKVEIPLASSAWKIDTTLPKR